MFDCRYKKHDAVLDVIGQCVLRGISKRSAGKLLTMLQDEGHMFMYRIEASALCEDGHAYCNFTYSYEGDGQQVFTTGA